MRENITSENAHYLNVLSEVRTGWISHLEWAADGFTVGIAGAEGVQVYSGKFGGTPTHTIGGHSGHVKGVAFTPYAWDVSRQLMASCGSDTTIKLWDISNLKDSIQEIGTLTSHQDSVDALTFALDPEGRLILAACGADGKIILHDVDTQTIIATLTGHQAEVTSAVFALKNHVIISGSRDKSVRLWDTRGETEGTIIGEHDDWVRDVCASPTGTMVASASKDMTVRLWDPHSGEMYALIQAHADGADCVRFSPDGDLLATGGRDNVVRLWDVNTILRKRKLTTSDAVATLNAHDKPVLTIGFNGTGTLLASGSGDNSVKLWSVNRTTQLGETPPRETQTAILDSE
ncbi:MAG: WD40 repeat domain-containing protein [Aggregatilineales bacterium]